MKKPFQRRSTNIRSRLERLAAIVETRFRCRSCAETGGKNFLVLLPAAPAATWKRPLDDDGREYVDVDDPRLAGKVAMITGEGGDCLLFDREQIMPARDRKCPECGRQLPHEVRLVEPYQEGPAAALRV